MTLPTVICANPACQRPFKARISHGKRRRFCSPACYQPARAIRPAPVVPAICENPACRRSFMPRLTGHGKLTKFCSRACWEANPGYSARHVRVRQARGRAKNHPCADCGRTAREWSLTHGRDGIDPADYEPRCRKCHVAYDGSAPGQPGGERNPNAKLTWAQVEEVRALRGTVPARVLAARFGVSRSVISMIMLGLTWKEPPSPG